MKSFIHHEVWEEDAGTLPCQGTGVGGLRLSVRTASSQLSAKCVQRIDVANGEKVKQLCGKWIRRYDHGKIGRHCPAMMDQGST